MNKNRIQPKDLITVGIFSAIMMVVCFAASMLGFIPIFIPLLSVVVPIVGGIPFNTVADVTRRVCTTLR